MSHQGKCSCGQVSYEITGDPIAVAICHCKNCQRQSGSAFSVNLVLRSDQVTLSGIGLKTFEDSSEEGGAVYRKFCPECGSPVLSTMTSAPGMSYIKAGTLDDTAGLTPVIDVWCQSAQSWVNLGLDIPHFQKNVPSGS